LVEMFAAFRWQILLRVQKIRISFPRIAGLFFIGMFYNQFLPGGTGGDIIKSYLLLKETPDKKAGALLAVVFDRLIGLVALVAITVTLISLRFDILSKTPETRRLLWILLFLLRSSITALLTSFIISGFNLFHWLPDKFPGREKLLKFQRPITFPPGTGSRPFSPSARRWGRIWRRSPLFFASPSLSMCPPRSRKE